MRGGVGVGALGTALLACSGPTAPSFAPLVPGPRAHGPVASAAPEPTAKPKKPAPPPEPAPPVTVELPVGASPGTPAAERTTEIVRDLVARFDLWPGLGLHTVYPAQFGKVLAADDAARAAFEARWSKMLLDVPGEAGVYGSLVHMHQALVLDVQRVALHQVPGAATSASVKAWTDAQEVPMLTGYLRAWADRARLPGRSAALVRARLGHWEEALGIQRVFSVATALGIVPPKKGFSLGAAPAASLGPIPAERMRDLLVQALGEKVVPASGDMKSYIDLDVTFVIGAAALSRDGKWHPPTQPFQPGTKTQLQSIEAKALALLGSASSSNETRLQALSMLDTAGGIGTFGPKGRSTSIPAVVAGYILVFRARTTLHPAHAALPEYARVRLAVLEDTLGTAEIARISAGAKLPYQSGMWALPGVLP